MIRLEGLFSRSHIGANGTGVRANQFGRVFKAVISRANLNGLHGDETIATGCRSIPVDGVHTVNAALAYECGGDRIVSRSGLRNRQLFKKPLVA